MGAFAVSSSQAYARHDGVGPRVSHNPDETILWLAGDQDIATMGVLAEALAEAIALDAVDVVVDLSEVKFIDAATISVLIRGRKCLLERSRNLTLRSPSRCARRLLDTCGLSGLVQEELGHRVTLESV
jgi:anti-anti-sigma factor